MVNKDAVAAGRQTIDMAPIVPIDGISAAELAAAYRLRRSLVIDYSETPHDQSSFLFRGSRDRTAVVPAGEALFLPYGTFHAARYLNLRSTITVDPLRAASVRDFVDEFYATKRRAQRDFRTFALAVYLHRLAPLLRAAERSGVNLIADWANFRMMIGAMCTNKACDTAAQETSS